MSLVWLHSSCCDSDLIYVCDAALRKAPKWLKTPVGVTFGFGGKLVSFAPKKTPSGVPATASEVFDNTIHIFVTVIHHMVSYSEIYYMVIFIRCFILSGSFNINTFFASGQQIRINHLITEEGLVKRSTEFEEAIAGGDRSALRSFCESKASSAG